MLETRKGNGDKGNRESDRHFGSSGFASDFLFPPTLSLWKAPRLLRGVCMILFCLSGESQAQEGPRGAA